MADLTLDQFKEVPEEELGQRLKDEAEKMFGPDSNKNNSGKTTGVLYPGPNPKRRKMGLGLRYPVSLIPLIIFPIQIP